MNRHFLICVILIILEAKISLQLDFVLTGGHKLSKSIIKRNVVYDFPKIKEYIVKTKVANRFAETNVSSKVENVDTEAKQTTFSVVIPERAFISGFFMEIEGEMYKGKVLEKTEAERIPNQSVPSNHSAAHLRASTRNADRFTININMKPMSSVTFHLTYQELLQRERGQYEIISNIQPGQIVEKLKVEVEITESRPLSFIRTPSLSSGNIRIENNIRLVPNVTVRYSGSMGTVEFYPDTKQQLQFACAGLGYKDYNGFAGQFVVQYDISRDADDSETLSQDGFFISFAAPPNLDPIPKHIVFVLDTSGSMYGTKISQLKEAMISILSQLQPYDLFSIVQYGSDVYLWDLDLNSVNVLPTSPNYGHLADQIKYMPVQDAVYATKENVDKAKNIINKLEAADQTNIIGALEIGLYLVKLVQIKYKEQYQPILMFLTDGLPNVGISSTKQIISLITAINSREYETPIYSLGIGDDVRWTFLQKLSFENGGKPTRIHTGGGAFSDVSGQLQSFYETISTPVLSNVTVKAPDALELTEQHFPIYFDGSEIIVAGKYASSNGPKPITISAKGKEGQVELEAKIGIPLIQLECLWAYLTVKQVLDQIATSSQLNKTELSKIALYMSLKYSLLTDLTSLVVAKPSDINYVINTEDASVGIFPVPPNELPICSSNTDGAANMDIPVAIIDMSNVLGRISMDQVNLIESILIKALDKRLENSRLAAPIFNGMNYSGGILQMAYGNQMSLEWLKEIIAENRNLWKGADLHVVPLDQLPKPKKATVFITNKDTTEVIMRRLKAQNPWASVKNWVLLQEDVQEKPQGRLLTFAIGDEDRAALNKKGGKMNYLFSFLTVSPLNS